MNKHNYKVWDIVYNRMIVDKNTKWEMKVKCKDCWSIAKTNSTIISRWTKCKCARYKKKSNPTPILNKKKIIVKDESILRSLCTIQSYMIKNNIQDMKVSDLLSELG